MSGPSAKVRRRRSGVGRAVVLWAVIMAPLLWWGLPNRRDDALLFGGQNAWPAERYRVEGDVRALGARDAGADTDLNPLPARDTIVELTADEAGRAEILRRYRLYSRQPDEMIVLRALQRMNPRALDFDPRLYQYGGGYVYLVGAAMGAAALTGVVSVTSALGYYLEHPEAFARFYVVARFISLAFGALTLVAVHRLARRAGGRGAAWIAFVCVACTPVFISAVVEAKPHLPAAGVILWATLAALDFRVRPCRRHAWRLGALVGYACGLVLTGVVGVVLWPVLMLARADRPARATARLLGIALLVAVVVYGLTNPYVVYNGLFSRATLASNIDNSVAMYRHQIERAAHGAARVAELLHAGAGVGVPLVGLVGLALALRRHGAAALLAAGPAAGMLAVCVLLGADKPAEFARFLILPIVMLSVATATALASLARQRPLLSLLATLIVLLAMPTSAYVRALGVDARGWDESRRCAGRFLREHATAGDAFGVLQEPAPYAVPPLDFARGRVLLLPAERPADLRPEELPAWLVFTADDERTRARDWWQAYYAFAARFPEEVFPLSPITWANKPVYIYRREGGGAGELEEEPATAPAL